MKYMQILLSCLFLFILSGCGHSMYHKVQGTGLYGRIPTPNGSSLIEVAIGDMNITSGILRGGATLDENTSKGGTFGSVSIGRHTHMSTVPAINEGNIEAVLTSPNTDDKTKQLIALYLITRKNAQPPTAAVTAVNAGSATGKKEVPVATPTRTGVDNVVDNVAEVTPEIVKPIVKSTETVAKHVATTVGDKSESVIKSFFNRATYIIIGIVILLILVAIIIIIFLKRKQKNKTKLLAQAVETIAK